MTNTPHDADPGEADGIPPGSPAPGESAPLHGSDDPAPPSSRQDDEEEAENPHGRVISPDDV